MLPLLVIGTGASFRDGSVNDGLSRQEPRPDSSQSEMLTLVVSGRAASFRGDDGGLLPNEPQTDSSKPNEMPLFINRALFRGGGLGEKADSSNSDKLVDG